MTFCIVGFERRDGQGSMGGKGGSVIDLLTFQPLWRKDTTDTITPVHSRYTRNDLI